MVRFYEQALGFKVERTLERLSLVQMRAGASMLDLVKGERARAAATWITSASASSRSSGRIEKRLSPLGITLGETVERYGAEGTGLSVYFNDPEGNQIELKGPSKMPDVALTLGRCRWSASVATSKTNRVSVRVRLGGNEYAFALGYWAASCAALVLAAAPAFAQKSGGTLRISHRDNPPSASIHEEATISANQPFMAVFNNLVVFDPDRS